MEIKCPGILFQSLCIFIYENVLNWGGGVVLGKEVNSTAKFMSETDTWKKFPLGIPYGTFGKANFNTTFLGKYLSERQ